MGTIQRIVADIFGISEAISYEKRSAFIALCDALHIDPNKESILRNAQETLYPIPVIGYLSPDEIEHYRRISRNCYPDEMDGYTETIKELVKGRKAKQLPMDWLYKDDD